MNQDVILEIIKFVNNTNNIALANKSCYDACEIFYSIKINGDFMQNVIPNLSNRQTYFIYDQIKRLKKPNDTDYNNIAFDKKCFFPSIICKFVNIESLRLNVGRIRTIPSEILALINLRVLNLSCNYISSFPDQILQLTKLEILNLSHNELETIPNISNLTNLNILDLSHNRIKYFEAYDEISNNSKLTIDLQNNINVVI